MIRTTRTGPRWKRKTLFAPLVLLFLIFKYPANVVADEIRFIDIDGDSREHLIKEAAKLGIVSGYSDSTFKPNNLVTREQMVAMMVSALKNREELNLPELEFSGASFSDVPPNRWSFQAIETAKQLGLVSGYQNGTFKPDAPLKRAEAVVMNYQLFGYIRNRVGINGEFYVANSTPIFTDLEFHWSKDRVKTMASYCHAASGLPISSILFEPNRSTTRAVAASIIVRGFECLQIELDELNQSPVPIEEESWINRGLKLCSLEKGIGSRKELLSAFSEFQVGERRFNWDEVAQNKESCVEYMLPIAIHMNIISGVPASTIIAQAIQETGWCKSPLSKKALNYHGQKAKFATNLFDHWDGSYVWHSSTESPTGEGSNQRSKFMKFEHFDHGFYSMVDRLFVPGLPYRNCLSKRPDTPSFMRCIGKSWAVHTTYAEVVLGHRSNFRHSKHSEFRLNKCDIDSSDWELHPKYR